MGSLRINYRGYDVGAAAEWTGLVVLMALNILRNYDDLAVDHGETYHRQIEAIKLAFADGKAYITDPNELPVNVEDLLSEEYGRKRQSLIGAAALEPTPGQFPQGGTVYLAAADNQGNMVSYIQSNYMGFGSGIVVPETGIALQNRGNNFSLDSKHPNCLKPGKRTYHTIIPGFLSKDGEPVGPFGVMGAFMQPQGHVQVVMNTIDFKLNPQAALDRPRWQWIEGRQVELESSVPNHIAQALAEGHQVRVQLPPVVSGGRLSGACPMVYWREALNPHRWNVAAW